MSSDLNHDSSPENGAYRYAAFISYRHGEPDRTWARWVHGRLETYRVPQRIVQKGADRRIGRVFRDEDELAASSELKAEIEEALAQSNFLIVICSPRTPESLWVNREVARFREMGRHDRILAVLIEGEPRDSFPQALREIRRVATDAQGFAQESIEQVEPLAADVRGAGREAKRLAALRLLAVMLGVRFDDLRQREHERRFRRLTAVGAVLATIAVAMTALAGIAVRQRNLARDNEARAKVAEAAARKDAGIANRRISELRDITGTFMFELDDAIARLPGATPARRMLAETSLKHLDLVSQDIADDPRLLSDLSHAYQYVGDILGNPNGANVNDSAGAMKSYAKARELIERRARIDPDDPQLPRDRLDIAQKTGDVLLLMNKPADALLEYQPTLALAKAAAEAHPEMTEAQRVLGNTFLKIGDAQLNLGKFDDAAGSYNQALKVFEPLSTKAASSDAPDKSQPRQDLATVYDRLGDVQSRTDHLSQACDSFLKARDILESILAADRGNALLQRAVATADDRLATVELKTQRIDDALASARKALELHKALSTADPTNARALRDLMASQEMLGMSLLMLQKMPEAIQAFQDMAQSTQSLVALDPPDVDARELQLAALNKVVGAQRLAGNSNAAVATSRKALALTQALAADHPDDIGIKTLLAGTEAKFAELLVQSSQLAEAVTLFRQSAAAYAAMADDPSNALAAHGSWFELLRAGAAEAALARRKDLKPQEQSAHFNAAASAFQESLDRLKKLHDAGRLATGDQGAIQAVITQIQSCKSEANRLSAGTASNLSDTRPSPADR